MIVDREQGAQRAEASRTNKPGRCQEWTREIFDAPSVGDYDGDGRADAEDGWKSEPAQYRHPGDRNPPRGVPVSFLGGRNDDGHRAASIGGGLIRSTDFDTITRRYKAGTVGTGTIAEVERAMGVTYAGWSDTIDGHLIPLPPTPSPAPAPARKRVRRPEVRAALNALRKVRDTAKNVSGRAQAQESIDQVKKDFPGRAK